MRKAVLFVLECSFFLVSIGSAPALAKEFSFQIITRQGEQTATGNVYVKDNKYRIERDGDPEYGILREDKRIWWAVDQSKRTYTEVPFNPLYRPRIAEKEPNETARKYIASEAVNGRMSTKYEISITEERKIRKFYQWTAHDLNLPVRIAAVDGTWSMDYTNFNFSVPDTLFELPFGYSRAESDNRFIEIYTRVWLLVGILLGFTYLTRRLLVRAERTNTD